MFWPEEDHDNSIGSEDICIVMLNLVQIGVPQILSALQLSF